MDPDQRSVLKEQARAEILFPTFISEYCHNCCAPLEGEVVKLNDYLPKSKTRIERHYCNAEWCVEDVVNHRNKVRRDENKTKHFYPIRNVSEMTLDLAKAFEMGLYYAAADRITPYRNVKHL